MNRCLIQGRKPHGRLDNGYAICDLRKERPLYSFGCGASDSSSAGRRKLPASSWIWQSPQLAEGPSTENAWVPNADLISCSNNSSNTALRHGALPPPPQPPPPPSDRELLVGHLRQMYGDQLFRKGKYMVPDQLGPAVEPPQTPRLRRMQKLFQSMRGRILGPVPRSVFDVAGSAASEDPECAVQNAATSLSSVFEWCDNVNNRNNNSRCAVQQRVSHRTAKLTAMRREIGNWVQLYFRARRVSWEFMVHDERTNFNLIDLFSDGVLDRWTVKLRFRMLRDAAMKFPLMAFLSRLGLDSEPDIIFTTDGFYGDMLVGSVRNRNIVPHRQVSYNTTAQALGLQNGDNIFVVLASGNLRTNVETHMEAATRRQVGFVADNDDYDNGSDEDENEDDEVEEEDETDEAV